MRSASIRLCARFLAVILSVLLAVPAQAQSVFNLPTPGTMVTSSLAYMPTVIKGVQLDPEQPLRFEFLMDRGDAGLIGQEFEDESEKLIKYFLAALTIPENQLWVNLSPYEQNRIIADGFGQTEMGRDMLAQDYMLKQLSSSLLYPENELGKKFWSRVYELAHEKYGTTDIPTDVINKIWIVPHTSSIHEHAQGAFIVDSTLKVLLEEDYIAISHQPLAISKAGSRQLSAENLKVMRELILPEVEREVNEGKIFANLRQMYQSMILATWYKNKLKDSLLSQTYVNQEKVAGVNVQDTEINQKIYDQYVAAFNKGVYDYIREEDVDGDTVPRKYFSGGTNFNEIDSDIATPAQARTAANEAAPRLATVVSDITPDSAMAGVQEKMTHAQVTQEFVGLNADTSGQIIGRDDRLDLLRRAKNLIEAAAGKQLKRSFEGYSIILTEEGLAEFSQEHDVTIDEADSAMVVSSSDSIQEVKTVVESFRNNNAQVRDDRNISFYTQALTKAVVTTITLKNIDLEAIGASMKHAGEIAQGLAEKITNDFSPEGYTVKAEPSTGTFSQSGTEKRLKTEATATVSVTVTKDQAMATSTTNYHITRRGIDSLRNIADSYKVGDDWVTTDELKELNPTIGVVWLNQVLAPDKKIILPEGAELIADQAMAADPKKSYGLYLDAGYKKDIFGILDSGAFLENLYKGLREIFPNLETQPLDKKEVTVPEGYDEYKKFTWKITAESDEFTIILNVGILSKSKDLQLILSIESNLETNLTQYTNTRKKMVAAFNNALSATHPENFVLDGQFGYTFVEIAENEKKYVYENESIRLRLTQAVYRIVSMTGKHSYVKVSVNADGVLDIQPLSGQVKLWPTEESGGYIVGVEEDNVEVGIQLNPDKKTFSIWNTGIANIGVVRVPKGGNEGTGRWLDGGNDGGSFVPGEAQLGPPPGPQTLSAEAEMEIPAELKDARGKWADSAMSSSALNLHTTSGRESLRSIAAKYKIGREWAQAKELKELNPSVGNVLLNQVLPAGKEIILPEGAEFIADQAMAARNLKQEAQEKVDDFLAKNDVDDRISMEVTGDESEATVTVTLDRTNRLQGHDHQIAAKTRSRIRKVMQALVEYNVVSLNVKDVTTDEEKSVAVLVLSADQAMAATWGPRLSEDPKGNIDKKSIWLGWYNGEGQNLKEFIDSRVSKDAVIPNDAIVLISDKDSGIRYQDASNHVVEMGQSVEIIDQAMLAAAFAEAFNADNLHHLTIGGIKRMINSFIRKATGQERGRAIAIDWGGSNLRVSLLDVNGTKATVIKEAGKIDFTSHLDDMVGAIDLIADKIVELTEGEDIDVIGFGFSFPLSKQSANRGVIPEGVGKVKGWNLPGIVGQDPGLLLEKALRERRKNSMKVSVIINDTDATLASTPEATIAIIYASGFNMAYVNADGYIVNMEAGHVPLPDSIKLTEAEQYVMDHVEPIGRALEKIVSGKYLKLILKRELELAWGEDRYNELMPSKNSKIDDLISFMETFDDISELNPINFYRTLKKEFNMENIKVPEIRLLKETIERLSRQSARFVSIAIAETLKKIDPDFSKDEHIIVIDGALFENHPRIRQYMNRVLHEYLGDLKSGKIELRLKSGALLEGTAIAAVENANQDQAMISDFNKQILPEEEKEIKERIENVRKFLTIINAQGFSIRSRLTTQKVTNGRVRVYFSGDSFIPKREIKSRLDQLQKLLPDNLVVSIDDNTYGQVDFIFEDQAMTAVVEEVVVESGPRQLARYLGELGYNSSDRSPGSVEVIPSDRLNSSYELTGAEALTLAPVRIIQSGDHVKITANESVINVAKENSGRVDQAMVTPTGGIDMNATLGTMDIERSGSGFIMPTFTQEMIDAAMNAGGFVPVIIDVNMKLTVPQLFLMLGLNERDEDVQIATI